MSNFNKTLSKRLRLNHAYGQLIALILVPIAVLTSVGILWVLSETTNSAKQQQRSDASAILARYHQTAADLLRLVQERPDQYYRAQNIMQKMFNEKNLQRAVLIDSQGQTYLSVGYQNNRFWPTFPNNSNFFGPIQHNHNSIYGTKIKSDATNPVWLMVELDNHPLELARYKILLSLVVTGLITLLILLFCLNVFSRRWLAPLYEIRMQMQRLNADTLDQHIVVNSTGELRLLQRD
ncbi:MAG: GacS-like sensor histidine kinase, partial [Acinetobacter junii]